MSRYKISFHEVSFGYPGAEHKAIDSIDFTLPEGRTYALVGPSGDGKTTIARLIPRFWDADSGQVTIGGIDVKDIAPEELMRNISFVFQNTRLFKTTLQENVCYGHPTASQEDVEAALEMAQCRELVDRLPNRLNTRIGIDGTYLSGGEQQRIALARAILKDAPVVVLDEATASLDVENETKIQAGISELIRDKTVLIIAHRMRTVANAEKIVVLDNGRVLEHGSPDHLKSTNGAFAHTIERQMQPTP